MAVLVTVLISNTAMAQNLVLNGSFEDYSSCPNGIDQVSNADFWSRPSEGTSDYFHTCAAGSVVGVPDSGFGNSAAADGDAYVGIVGWVDAGVIPTFVDYREYISGQLDSNLTAGKRYRASLSMRYGDEFQSGVLPLGMHFRDSELVLPSTGTNWPPLSAAPYSISPQVQWDSLSSADSTGWHRLEQEFWADGSERHLIIGNFADDANSNAWTIFSAPSPMAYIFLDAIEVSQVMIPPIAVADTVYINAGESILIDLLANDSDEDGVLDPSSISLLSTPALGSGSLDLLTGELDYSADGLASGSDVFDYQICDEEGNCSSAAVVVIVSPTPTNPIAIDDFISTLPGLTSWIQILENDDHASTGWQLGSLTLTYASINGMISFETSSGMALYTAGTNFCGIDSFRYRICNDGGDCVQAWVRIESVCPDAVCLDDFVQAQDGPQMIDVLGNDEPGWGLWDPMTLSIEESPDFGSVTINFEEGYLVYSAAGFEADSLRYRICDNGSNCASATLHIAARSADAVIDPPVDPPFSPSLHIPTVITPNGDGLNDSWIIEGLEETASSGYSLYIYDRWERLVFSTDNYQNDWSALRNGKRLPDGTFYYVLDFQDDQQSDRTGAITVFR